VAEDRSTENGGLGPRWTEGPLVGRAREAEAIELFRAATSLPGFSAVSSQRVWRRLGASRPARRWLRPAVIVGALVAAGAATAASLAVMRTLSRPAGPRLSSPAPTVRRGLARPAESFAPEPPVIRASDVPAPPAKASAKRPPHPKRSRATAAAQRTRLAEDPGTLGKETTLFREALSLRAARDPRAAIAVLDRYAALYPAAAMPRGDRPARRASRRRRRLSRRRQATSAAPCVTPRPAGAGGAGPLPAAHLPPSGRGIGCAGGLPAYLDGSPGRSEHATRRAASAALNRTRTPSGVPGGAAVAIRMDGSSGPRRVESRYEYETKAGRIRTDSGGDPRSGPARPSVRGGGVAAAAGASAGSGLARAAARRTRAGGRRRGRRRGAGAGGATGAGGSGSR
jgi:hypothetical protein